MLRERIEPRRALGSGLPAPRVPGDATIPSVVAAQTTPRWVQRQRRLLVSAEALLAAGVAVVVLACHPDPLAVGSDLFWASLSLVVVWPMALAAVGAYEERLFGTGSDEFRRVGSAGLLLLALLGTISYAAALELSRALVVIGVPALALLTLGERYAARLALHRQRLHGRCVKRAVLVGRGGAVLELADSLQRTPHAGLVAVAACVTSADRTRVARAVALPVAGLDEVLATAARLNADSVVVTSASETAAQYLRSLSWQLEGTGLELLVAPGLVEVAGPRLHIRPFDGLPLLAIEQPRFEGWRRVVKGAIDRSVACAALLVLLPVFALLALAVRLSGPGPVFYRQERTGLDGRPFRMIKFRSMVVDAEHRLEELREANVSDGLLFKIQRDPRVTPVGRWLRRLSLDELPQLCNVLGGSMSLVGPRPPLPTEVARYDSSVRRRLLVKPGLTGLWQISGRSDLSWEESVRLDLRYVENWSLALDLSILRRTFSAVLHSRGAY